MVLKATLMSPLHTVQVSRASSTQYTSIIERVPTQCDGFFCGTVRVYCRTFFSLKLVYDCLRTVSGEVRGARTLPQTSFVCIVKRFQTKFTLSRSAGSGLTWRVMTMAKQDEVKEAITTNPHLSARKVACMSNM